MIKTPVLVAEILLGIVFSAVGPNRVNVPHASACAAAFPKLTSRDSLFIRQTLLRQINRDRRRHGLAPVKLDHLASKVADRHCREMIRKNYLSHWNTNGLKPYHRYAFAGGRDHLAENLYASSIRGATFKCTVTDISDRVLEGQRSFMAEKPPYDGHRKNILRGYHTHVGIGFACSNHEFRMAEEFVDRYIALSDFATRIRRGDRRIISGKILKPGLYPVMATVDFEPFPKRKSTKELKKLGSYLDGSSQRPFTTVTAWDMSFYPKTRRFYFTLDFSRARRGYYYMIIYLSQTVDQRLYKNSTPRKTVGTFRLTTEHAIPATGVVFILH